ncbi:transcription initiation factor IID, 18kD subunit-domain-containing protein [Mycena filopes]|nr:transcription initiation factor IID, 18kD subunit-domain-containing protein [Mycena filopes]
MPGTTPPTIIKSPQPLPRHREHLLQRQRRRPLRGLPLLTLRKDPSTYTPSHLRESVAAAGTGGATGRGSRKPANVRGLFTKELKNIMYGFGDDRNPATDTVNVMEEILIEYITDVCQTAGAQTKRARLSIEDLRRALSRPADGKKLARMEELLVHARRYQTGPSPIQ